MTPPPDHPGDQDAFEYVAGTLPAAEREALAAAMARDPALRAAVAAWEARLAPLAERVPGVPPSPGLWTRIDAALDGEGRGVVVPGPGSAEFAALRRSRATWRAATAAAASLAAALAIWIAVDRAAPGPSSGLVAVVNRSGELPALLVRVDPRAGTVQIRALAAETPANGSLELWSIVGTEAPRSLGLVGAGATRVSVRQADRPRLDGATIAVTAEQAGGSPDGRPHGPVVYSGKLVPEAP